jgi:hypothetical protein
MKIHLSIYGWNPNFTISKLRYESLDVNLEIQWIEKRSILDKLFILSNESDIDYIKRDLSLPAFVYFINNPKLPYVYKMDLFKYI